MSDNWPATATNQLRDYLDATPTGDMLVARELMEPVIELAEAELLRQRFAALPKQPTGAERVLLDMRERWAAEVDLMRAQYEREADGSYERVAMVVRHAAAEQALALMDRAIHDAERVR
jgi:hypothetical protein